MYSVMKVMQKEKRNRRNGTRNHLAEPMRARRLPKRSLLNAVTGINVYVRCNKRSNREMKGNQSKEHSKAIFRVTLATTHQFILFSDRKSNRPQPCPFSYIG